jgi:ElaB/YqjD/DUF883 family membrane-anchored ribosome-binding protein
MSTSIKNNRRQIAHSGNHAMKELRQQASDIGDSIRSMAVTAGTAAGSSLDPIESYVREKPLKSLAMAMGVGAVLGIFLLRR